MDSQTHVSFASEVLKTVGGDTSYAVFSLLPALDREPPHQHRLMLHSFFALPVLVRHLPAPGRGSVEQSPLPNPGSGIESGKQTLWGEECPLDGYVRERLPRGIGERRWNEELERQLSRVDISEPKSRAEFSLAFATHLFLDTWNNPVQCFVPWSDACSYQWGLFQREEYFVFRVGLYERECITSLRGSALDSKSWPAHSSDAVGLLLGIIDYMKDLSRPGLDGVSSKIASALLDQLQLSVDQSSRGDSSGLAASSAFWRSLGDLISVSIRRALGLRLSQGGLQGS